MRSNPIKSRPSASRSQSDVGLVSDPAGAQAARYSFCIFVAGESMRSQRAVASLKALCDTHSPGSYDIEVVDVLVTPERAEHDRVIATPTVLRRSPPPVRRVVGDLSDFGLAAQALGLDNAT